MNRQDAESMMNLYARSKYAVSLTATQRDAVVAHLMRVFASDSDATTSDVREVVNEVVTGRSEMPTEKAVNKFAQQAQTEQQQMLADVFRHKLLPGLENPFAFDNTGRVVGVGNTIAFNIMSDALAHWYEHFGNVPMTRGRVVELVAKLDLTGRWPHVLPRVDENPPAPVKLDDNAINNQRRENDRRRNTEGDSPIKGVAAVAKPKPTEAELVQAAEAGLAEEAACQSVIRIIAHYSPQKSRGAITEEKAILARVFDDGKAAGKTFVQLEADVKAQVEAMAKWDNSEAIRRNYASAAARRGVDLTKREPKKFAGDAY